MTTETSARYGLPYLAAGQAQKELTHNEAVALIDIATNAAALSVGDDTPPTSPGEGACWIVGDAPAGAWVGEGGSIACWTTGGWRFVRPTEGMTVWIIPDQEFAVFDGGDWIMGEIRGRKLVLEGDQVVGARLGAVAAPSAGTIIDAEARAAIELILERLRTHGLIAT